ncbi:MAG: histidine triad nucleotide-binding protein [Candidatus Omnitrophota bacterium]
MTDPDCLFCKILSRKIPSTVVYENDDVLGIEDINPQAPVHALMISKTHIAGVHEISPSSYPGAADRLVHAANEAARRFKIDGAGYRLVINCKKDGGQTVDHLHLHLLGGRRMTWPPG